MRIKYAFRAFFRIVAVLYISCSLRAAFAQSPDPETILDKIDQNMFTSTITYTGRMIIRHEGRVDEKVMKVWGEGKEMGFMEFTQPARDQGTKYLKLKDDLWMYLPNVEKVIKISGHLLRQSMMGSDFSYEDSMERNKLREDYAAEYAGVETHEERQCHVLELTAQRKDVTYYRMKIWVDQERNVVLKSERYAKTGKLLKVMTAGKVDKFENRYYPTIVTMEDKIRKESKTEMVMENIRFNVLIPEEIFTRRNLEKR